MLVGPFISNALGWQVTSTTAKAQTHLGLVEQRASICAAKARAQTPDAAKLDWNAGSVLAKQMAALPGMPEPDWELTTACARKLET